MQLNMSDVRRCYENGKYIYRAFDMDSKNWIKIKCIFDDKQNRWIKIS